MNAILITIDSLRADHLSCLGYPKKTSPNLDRFARKGVLFTNAISCGPDTPTSIVPIMTSSYVLTYYILSGDIEKLKTSVDEFERMRKVILEIYRYENTIAGTLGRYGYKTAAFHSNPYLSRYYNFGRDFEYFYDSLSQTKYSLKQKIKAIVERSNVLYDISWFLYKNIYNKIKSILSIERSHKLPYERAESINSKVLSWLKNNKKEKFFIWIHYMDVHFPYIPPEEFRSVDLSTFEILDLNNKMLKEPSSLSEDEIEILIRLYDDEIRYVDQEIKSLIDSIDDLGIFEDTLIIITADHGDEFGDHGDFAHHNAKLYDELTRVPLIIFNSDYSGLRIDETVSLLDVAPTLLDFLEITKPFTFQGKSLIHVIEGKPRGDGVISESLQSGKRNIAYRTNKWKYILDNFRNRKELYNLLNDPKEKENIYNKENKVAKLFEQKVIEHIMYQERRVRSLKRKKMKENIRKLKFTRKL